MKRNSGVINLYAAQHKYPLSLSKHSIKVPMKSKVYFGYSMNLLD